MADGQVVFTVEMDDVAFQAGLARMGEALGALSQSVFAAFTPGDAQWQAARAAGVQWMGSFASGMRAGSAVSTALKSAVAGAAAAAAPTARAGGASVGRNLVSGIVSGVNAQGSALNAALQGIVASALAAARSAAGIRSPSTLFRDQVGRYLALGVQEGFTGTMAGSVLPAMSRSLAQSAAAGRRVLDGTLLAGVRRALDASVVLPDAAALSASALTGGVSGAYAASAPAAGGDAVYNVTQNITFASVLQAPDEVARAVRRQATYGLAAARG